MSHQPLNIHAGTHIVTKVGVHGSNNALVHPRGAVGIVTRTPCGNGAVFSHAFPDGSEASLLREELEVLKLFKDRLDPADASDFDLEAHVNQDSPFVVLKVLLMVSLKSLESSGIGNGSSAFKPTLSTALPDPR